MIVLLDSNILVYLLSVHSPFHAAARAAVARLLERGDRPVVALQNLLEFWVHATRPAVHDGLGYDPATARLQITTFLKDFALLPEAALTPADVFGLAERYGVRGRVIHDTRLVASMVAHGVTRILSYDAELDRFSEISRIEPEAIR